MILAQDLRDSVLQAAIQGKLTEQLPTDSSAEELLAKIIVTKKEMILNKSIIKDNSCKITPYNSTDMDIMEIPSTWKWVKLGEICTKVGAGSTPTGGSKVYSSTGIKFFREQNIHNSGLCYDGIVYITKETNATMSSSQVQAQDILLNITGASIGRNSLVPDNFDVANVNQHVLIIRLVDTRLRNYLHWCLCSPFIFNQMMSGQKGDKPGLSATRVSNFLLPIPPIEEQERILKRISKLMSKIDEYEKIEKQLSTLKATFRTDLCNAILRAAMQGKLTKQLETDSSVKELITQIDKEREFLITSMQYKFDKKLTPIDATNIPFNIPNTWSWIKLGYCSTYGQAKTKATLDDINSDIWSLDLEDIEKRTGNILIKKKANERQIKGDKIKFTKGDILYSKLRPYLLKILIANNDGICTPELIPFHMIGDIDSKYILWVLRSPHINYTINKATYGVKMPRVGTGTIINLLIPLPPIEEQQRIVKQLDTLLPLCNEL